MTSPGGGLGTAVVPTSLSGKRTAADFAKMTQWYAALANRNTARANVVLMGASLVDGYGATLYSNHIAQQMMKILRARFPTTAAVTGGRGYIGANTSGLGGNPNVYTGGAFDDTTYNLGAKHRSWFANAAAKVVITLAAPVTSFDINHVLNTLGGATTGYYKIDVSAAVPFNTLGGSAIPTVLHVASPATATIEIGWNAAGYIFFDGITEYNGDENAGIQVHDCGHSGYSANQWYPGVGAAGTWPTSMALLNPSLIIMHDYGVNDGWTANGNQTASQFKTSLTALIAGLRLAGMTCPILLPAVYDTSAAIVFAQPGWQNYVSAMQQIANTDPTISFLDESARMPPTLGNPFSLYSGDLVHSNVNGNGYQMLAEILVDAISPY